MASVAVLISPMIMESFSTVLLAYSFISSNTPSYCLSMVLVRSPSEMARITRDTSSMLPPAAVTMSRMARSMSPTSSLESDSMATEKSPFASRLAACTATPSGRVTPRLMMSASTMPMATPAASVTMIQLRLTV